MTTETIGLPQRSDAGEKTRAEPRVKAPPAPPPHAAGMLWFGGWLFTISFAKLVWWKALLALIVWPYFLGGTLR
jgi:hypothetical protein